MTLPERIPGLSVATMVVGGYGLVWIALEGNLGRVLLLAVGVTLVALGHGGRRLGGRRFSRPGWLLLAGVGGLLAGGGSGLLALLLMGVKTGLHAHGAEFTATEVAWVVRQVPWWATAGLLAGAGLGAITLALAPAEKKETEGRQ